MIQPFSLNLSLQTVRPFSITNYIQCPSRLGTMNNFPCFYQIVKPFLIPISPYCNHFSGCKGRKMKFCCRMTQCIGDHYHIGQISPICLILGSQYYKTIVFPHGSFIHPASPSVCNFPDSLTSILQTLITGKMNFKYFLTAIINLP